MKFTWKIGGEAGFGIMTTGLIFSKIVTRHGYYIHDFIEYPSLIRGGHNAYEVTISDQSIGAPKEKIDLLVCLNQETFSLHKKRLAENALVIYDSLDFSISEKNYQLVDIHFQKILDDFKGQQIMKNTIALGASLALIGADLQELHQILESQFGRKGKEVVEFNQKFASAGFDQVREKYASLIKTIFEKKTVQPALVITGNDAFSLGSVVADCRFYCAYPMTPSSGVLTDLAAWQNKVGLVVRHAEDEISVINTAIGASFTGVRSAVGTSGGGFALMVEAVSLAGITEIPVVIFVAQRPGPATGMPTWTEQADLLFSVFSGHGEFPKIVLAPGDVEEMLKLSAEAYNLADIYQTPVIVLSDMFLSESHQSLLKSNFDDFANSYQVKRGKLVNKPSTNPYLRYQVTADGISERLLPGTKNYFYQSNSYEHLEDGHSTEVASEVKKQVEKRAQKEITYLKNDFQLPKVYGDLEKAETIFVSWGGVKNIILENMGQNSALIHFTYVYPLDSEKIKPLLTKNKRYILVENNATGQLGKLLMMTTGIEIKEKLLKYDGRSISCEEIVRLIS